MAGAKGAVMQVQLFKKVGKYVDKEDGKEKSSVRFYLRCGDNLVPIEVTYFKNYEGKDYQYNGRKEVLKAFADNLPEKENTQEKPASKIK